MLFLSLLFLYLAFRERQFALLGVPVAAAYVMGLVIFRFERPSGLNLRNLLIFFVPGLIGAVRFARGVVVWWDGWQNLFGWVNNDPFWIASGVTYYVGLPIMVMAGLSAVYFLSEKDRRALLFTLAAVVPLLAIMALSLFQYTANRYVFMSLPFWLILASIGVKELHKRAQGKGKLLAGAALAIIVLTSLSEDVLYYRYQHGNRPNWKAAFDLVEAKREPGDTIFTPDPVVAEYYLHEQTRWMSGVDVASLEAGEARRTWFVVDMDVEHKWPGVHRWIVNNARLVGEMDVHVRARTFIMRVYLYEPAIQTSKAAKVFD